MKTSPFSYAFRLCGFGLLPWLGIARADPLQSALDDPALEWQASSGWQPVAGPESLDGQDAVRVAIAYGGELGERIETSVVGPGLFRLWWRVSQGDDENDMILELDGVPVLPRDGDPHPWEPVALNVPEGTHRIAIRARSDGRELEAWIDQAVWSPGSRLPAAVAMGDADGIWQSFGDWLQVPGGVDGNGDEARISLPAGPSHARLVRRLAGPMRAQYWRKATGGAAWEPSDSTWQRRTQILGGRVGEPAWLEFDAGIGYGQPAGSLAIDSLELSPLSQEGTIDASPRVPRFGVSEGSRPWMIAAAEAWPHGTGSAALVPEALGGDGRIEADFDGPGLLTWSWQKWSNLDERLAVSANGRLLGEFTDDFDSSGGFAPVVQEFSEPGPVTVAWQFLWGANGFNPMSLDDVLFSGVAAADERSAIDLAANARAYLSGAGARSQSLVSHDGMDALEITPAAPGGRTALTLPVNGPGVLSWWWRADLPEPAEFCLGRQGRVVSTLKESGVWHQSFLVLRPGEEWVRWEVCANGAKLTPSHRVWLDEIAFLPADVPVADAVDLSGPAWSVRGGAGVALPPPWSADGTDLLVLTGPHGTREPTAEVSAVLQGPGTLSFSLRAETSRPDTGAPWLLQIDNTYQWLQPPGPASAWHRYQVHLEAGAHTVHWVASPGAIVALDQIAVEDAYAVWAQSLPPESRAPLDDPDADGTPTLIEYAFGTSPLDPQPFSGVTVRQQDGRQFMEYSMDTTRTGVAVETEVSAALGAWQEVPARLVSRTGTLETWQVELTSQLPFGRLRVRR